MDANGSKFPGTINMMDRSISIVIYSGSTLIKPRIPVRFDLKVLKFLTRLLAALVASTTLVLLSLTLFRKNMNIPRKSVEYQQACLTSTVITKSSAVTNQPTEPVTAR